MIFSGKQRVLVLAPHMDDEVIGCGGSLLKHQRENRKLAVVYFTDGSHFVDSSTDRDILREIRRGEAERVGGQLGMKSYFLDIPDRTLAYHPEIVRQIVCILQEYQPDIVYLPHSGETDREHRLVNEIYSEACWLAEDTYALKWKKSMETPQIVLEYEVWTPLIRPQYWEDIGRYMDQKTELINLYSSQRKFCDYAQAARMLNGYRGTMLNGSLSYAEAFVFKKLIV